MLVQLNGPILATASVPFDAVLTCNVRNQSKPVRDYYKHAGYVDRRCKTCYRAWNDQWGRKNPERAKRTYPRNSSPNRCNKRFTSLALQRRSWSNV